MRGSGAFRGMVRLRFAHTAVESSITGTERATDVERLVVQSDRLAEHVHTLHPTEREPPVAVLDRWARADAIVAPVGRDSGTLDHVDTLVLPQPRLAVS